MKAPKCIGLLIMATVFIANTSLVQGTIEEEGTVEEEEHGHFPLQSSPDPKALMCFNERVKLSSSLIDCLNFPNGVPEKRVIKCNARLARNWDRLSLDRPKKSAVCPTEPPADTITDLVAVCEKASLDSDECKRLAETLIMLSTLKEEKEEVSTMPSQAPTSKPSSQPTNTPSFSPSYEPSHFPSSTPTALPTIVPSTTPTSSPTSTPTNAPTLYSSISPTNPPALKSSEESPNLSPSVPSVCPQDVKECYDGSYVSRNPNNNCAFEPCPPSPIFCPQDVKKCAGGSYVSRDPNNNCAFEPCP